MSTRHNPRLTRRYRRPASLPATRSQVRQRIDQLRTYHSFMAVLDQLNNDFLSEVMTSMEEQI